MKFKRITVDCSSENSETIAYILNESGSLGEVFDDYNDVKAVLDEKRWDYADAALFEPTERCCVSGFFTAETDFSVLISKLTVEAATMGIDLPRSCFSCETVDSAEWENEWKKYYKPFSLGNVVIVPEWIKYIPSSGEIPVLLNPGLAFGTGAHETTSMCVELMQRIPLKGMRVLDFGCGSGILGIAASKLGAKEVLFADIDEQAITATRYNCKLNGIEHPELVTDDVRNISVPADVVLANITADVLVSVEPIIRYALKNGGYAVISGIISDKKEEVVSAYSRNFTLFDSERKNEWSAYIFRL